MSSSTFPKIEWGDTSPSPTHPNTIEVGDPFQEAIGYTEPGDDSEWGRVRSGARDAWISSEDSILEVVVHEIKSASYTTPWGVTKTGWDGATGWDEWLSWARKGYEFDLFTDRATPASAVTCILLDPMRGPPTRARNGTFSLRLRFAAVNPADKFTGYTRA